ncbi:pickpocket protein 28 [Amyelois transitella]|uniref:pickpocket protein 28 n=1 Tax=Amyelois transitella TaxID=680683 RepID=UPI0029906FD9|nr:pickpocket protein 28 [Amyelois transitella]
MDTPVTDNERGNQPISLRKRRRARRKAIMKVLFLDYTQNTTLHGLKYTTEKDIHVTERVFWMLTFSLSLGMCLWLIHNVWHKWETSPVIVSFSEKIVPVEMVPFPSLTVCPQIKSRVTVYNYTKYFKLYFTGNDLPDTYNSYSNSSANITSDIRSPHDMQRFQDVSLICPLPFYIPTYDFDALPGPDVTNASTIDEIIRVSPTLDYFQDCYFMGTKKDCSELFSRVLTDEGVCFNFNGLAADEIFRMENIQKDYKYSDVEKRSSGWDPNTGYDNSENVDYLKQYPYRGQYTRDRPYLEVILTTPKEDYDDYCNVINKGYKVYAQHPASHPQSSVYSYAILPAQLSALALKVNMMNTSEKLFNYDSEIRQCFFSNEKYLKYFKLYTSSNCLLECMSNYTYKMCQCVSFHMPYTDSRSICTLQKADCLTEARGSNRKLIEYIEECECLPNCNSVTYEAEILKTEFHLEKSMTNLFKMSTGMDDVADYFNG